MRARQLVAERVDLVERERGGGVRVEHRREADELGPLLEHGAHRQLDRVEERPVQRGELRRVVGDRRRPQAGAVDDARHLDARAVAAGCGIRPSLRTLP